MKAVEELIGSVGRRGLPEKRGLEAFCEHLARDKNIGAFAKNHRDNRQALDGFRANRFEISCANQCALDWSRHDRFDLLGCQSGRFGLNRYLGLNKFWKDVELRIRRDEQAISNDDASERNNDGAKFE